MNILVFKIDAAGLPLWYRSTCINFDCNFRPTAKCEEHKSSHYHNSCKHNNKDIA